MHLKLRVHFAVLFEAECKFAVVKANTLSFITIGAFTESSICSFDLFGTDSCWVQTLTVCTEDSEWFSTATLWEQNLWRMSLSCRAVSVNNKFLS